MSRVQTPTSRRMDDAREQMHDGVRWATQRGRLMATLSIALLCIAALLGGLFIVAIKDAVFDLPVAARLVLLSLLLLGSLGVCLVLGLRPWLNQRFSRAAGEQIDRAAKAKQQPVTVGLSLNEPMDDDSLALMLLRRAETRAADVARSVKPKQAYPLGRLRRPGGWFALAAGAWLVFVIVMPAHALNLLARVMMPWADVPPFSLTQLEPKWSPAPPDAGDDVTLTVEPQGRMPESVQWIRLDELGEEAERFEMAGDARGGFSFVLRRVESPIDFRLEAYGRHTRTYTITPTPRAPVTSEPTDDAQQDGPTDASEPDGSATFDPDKIARRDLEAHRDWPSLKADVQRLIDALADAQSLAEAIDPSDVKAMQGLSDKLGQLTAAAERLAGEVTAMQGELPAEASALLDALADALTGMQSAALSAPPSTTIDAASGGGEPTSAQWLEQAGDAARADQQRIGRGLGPSDQPSDSGDTSGQPGEGPSIRDPSSEGTYDAANTSGDDGPLPDAAMQQVPASYRELVATYFDRLAEEQPEP